MNRVLCEKLGIAPKRWTYYGSDGPEEVVEYPNLSMWDGMGLLVEAIRQRGHEISISIRSSGELAFEVTIEAILDEDYDWVEYADTLPQAVALAAARALGIKE